MTHVVRRSFPFLPLVLFGLACSDDPSSPELSSPGDPAVTAASPCVPAALDEILIGLIQGMQGEVDALADAGAIDHGDATSLSRHLTNAQKHLEDGNYCGMNAQIEEFRDGFEEVVGIVLDDVFPL